jgi:UDP-N-acetylglucosamine 2-epimerase (non-hydrolysing)
MGLTNENERGVINNRVLVIAGTRPEVLKLYPLVLALGESKIDCHFVSTGQQKNLVNQTLNSLRMKVDQDLDLMREDQSPISFLTRAQEALTEVIKSYKPTLVVVQGDTTSALAGAIAGYLNKVQVGHVEAGLRSHNLNSPWPEEGIRRAIDALSKFLWFPTDETEHFCEKDQVGVVTGNTIVDTLRLFNGVPEDRNNRIQSILVTLHRRESFDTTIESALTVLAELSNNANMRIVFIEHPNPNVSNAIKKTGLRKSNVNIIQPLPYLEFIQIMNKADLVVTDSGGLQEEARSLLKPLIVLRDNSERMEAIDGKIFRLSPPSGTNIQQDILEIEAILRTEKVTNEPNPFGDGFAAQRIVQSILSE